MEKDRSGLEVYSCMQGFEEVPTKELTIKLDNRTFEAAKMYAMENNGPVTRKIGELIDTFVEAGFKPFSKAIPADKRMKMMQLEKTIHVFVLEDTMEKAREIAKKQNLSLADYLRISLCAHLVDKVNG